ncbi:MAG: DUF4159 domain-containing protein [Chlorobi bacterium]|nr:DUF4159 domain-containing protein [Chlorobiota bacterium]
MIKRYCILILLIFSGFGSRAQQLALLQYGGGGDWYANQRTSLPNLIRFAREQGMVLEPEQAVVRPGSPDIFRYPYIHATGHGRIYFTDDEAANLRLYLESGGFLHIDDNYGMDKYAREAIRRIFPDKELQELPADFELFHAPFDFPGGLPKIHEHDGKRPQAFGIFVDGRLVLLYTYETDLGDGWESYEVHRDPPEKHLEGLRMGYNILYYVFTH